jgi:autotransporter-associated beta strand protein
MKPSNPLFEAFPALCPFVVSATFVLQTVPALAADYYFDVNGTLGGSGVTDGTSYAVSGSYWSTGAGASDGTATTSTLANRHLIVFSAGTDASSKNIILTGSVNELGNTSVAGGIRVEEGNVSLTGGGRFYGASTQTVTTQSGTSLALSGNWDFYNRTVTFNTAASTSVSLSAIGGGVRSAGVIKTGEGLMTIAGAASANGVTTAVNNGELRIQNGNSLYSTLTSTVTVNGGTLSLDNNITVANNPVSISGTGYDNKGALLNHAGNNNYNSLITLAADSSIKSNAGSSLTLNPSSGNAITGAFGVTFGGAGNITVSKPIDSTVASLTKNDSGTLTLSGSNAFTGDTTIKAGTLVLGSNGTLASTKIIIGDAGSTSAVLDVTAKSTGFTISSNQALSGIGTVDANTSSTIGGSDGSKYAVTIDGIHAPGNNQGSQTIDGSLSYTATSIFEWDLASNTDTDGYDHDSNPLTLPTNIGTSGTDWDKVTVTGNLTIDQAATFKVINNAADFSNPFWSRNQQWTDIFAVSGTTASSWADTGVNVYSPSDRINPVDVSGYGAFNITGTTLTWTAVPEPTSALAGLLIAAGLLRRRRQPFHQPNS